MSAPSLPWLWVAQPGTGWRTGDRLPRLGGGARCDRSALGRVSVGRRRIHHRADSRPPSDASVSSQRAPLRACEARSTPALPRREPLHWLHLRHWSRDGKALVSAVLGLTALAHLDRFLRLRFLQYGIAFPSSLAGMMLLVALLEALHRLPAPKRLSPDHAWLGVRTTATTGGEWMASLLYAAVEWLTRWLALFFVPNLIMLPLAPVPRGAQLARVVVAMVLGAALSLYLNARMVLWLHERVQAPAAKDVPAVSAEVVSAGDALPSRPPSPPRLAALGAWAIAWALSLGQVWRQAAVGAEWRTASLWLALLSGTVLGFGLGQRMPRRVQRAVHPLIASTLLTYATVWLVSRAWSLPWLTVLAVYLKRPGYAWSVPASSAASLNGRLWSFGGPGNAFLYLLGPAVLSFAFQVYRRRALLQRYARPVLGGCLLASGAGLLGTALLARVLGLTAAARIALVPRTITAPLAMAISGMLGSDATLTATMVVLTGLLGANFGQRYLDWVMRDRRHGTAEVAMARGMAMGASAHGLGTAAMSNEREALPFSAIAMALVGTISTTLVSLQPFRWLLCVMAGVPPP